MWFAVIVAVIWICSAVGAVVTKESDCFGYALVASVVIGFGYLLLGK